MRTVNCEMANRWTRVKCGVAGCGVRGKIGGNLRGMCGVLPAYYQFKNQLNEDATADCIIKFNYALKLKNFTTAYNVYLQIGSKKARIGW